MLTINIATKYICIHPKHLLSAARSVSICSGFPYRLRAYSMSSGSGISVSFSSKQEYFSHKDLMPGKLTCFSNSSELEKYTEFGHFMLHVPIDTEIL